MFNKLDVTSIYHLMMTKDDYINSFRLSVAFNDFVDIEVLKKVASKLNERFPSVFGSLYIDKFNAYVKSSDNVPIYNETSEFKRVCNQELSNYTACLLYHNNILELEIYHAISDGMGAMYVFKEIIKEYLAIKYNITYQSEDIDISEELKDGFLSVKEKFKKVKKIKHDKTFKFPIKDNSLDTYIDNYEIDLNAFKTISKAHNASVNDFISLLVYRAITPLKQSSNKVVFLIPINLRRLFPSKTLKNFMAMADVMIDQEEDYLIIKQIQETLAKYNNRGYLGYEINKLCNPLLDYVPLSIKKFLVKLVFNLRGKETTTLTLSNLGKVSLGLEFDKYLDRISFGLSRRHESSHNVGVATINDKMIVSLTYDQDNIEFIKAFDKVLEEYAIEYKRVGF